ncbi:MAG: hypothetical protein RL521_144, partial [Bacteroidota bacterium]
MIYSGPRIYNPFNQKKWSVKPIFQIFLLTCKKLEMRKGTLMALMVIFSALFTQAQIVAPCGQAHAMDDYFNAHPEHRLIRDDAERYLNERTKEMAAQRGGGMTVYTIPVVFHVIHNYGTENISDEQILDGLAILNRDYRRQNSDTSVVVDAFDQLVADIGIEFKLATKDPDGNCTSGITRTVSDLTS